MTATDDPLVSTEWLAARLGDPKVKILDASFKMPGVMPRPGDDYLAAHIPGAVYFDVEAVCDRGQPAAAHVSGRRAVRARRRGAGRVDSGDTVVVYDAGGWVAAPRAWWMFLSFGHADVRILEGGLKKWQAEGRPTEFGKPSPTPGTFTATLDPAYLRSKQQMVANLDSGAEQVIDARAVRSFRGARSGAAARACAPVTSPGSRNLPYNELFDAKTGLMKSRTSCARRSSGPESISTGRS